MTKVEGTQRHHGTVFCIAVLFCMNALVVALVTFGGYYFYKDLHSAIQSTKECETGQHRTDVTVEAMRREIGDLKAQMSRLTSDSVTQDMSDIQTSTEEKRYGRREILSKSDLSSLIRGPPGPPGPPGKDGKDFSSLNLVRQFVNESVSKEWISLSSKLPTYGGTTFVRWGHSNCPKSSKLIYKGRTASPDYRSSGGGASYQCLPDDPEYYAISPNKVHASKITRVWYEVGPDHGTVPAVTLNLVPCAVCESDQRVTKLVIPAKTRCPTSEWTMEYNGYLMTSATHYFNSNNVITPTNQYFRTEYICVDLKLQSAGGKPSSGWGSPGSPLYLVKMDCTGAGDCPPYDANKALACTVCTK